MSDTVKLIIEIPKPMYESIQNSIYCGTLYEELKNGIPLDDVKAEIRTKHFHIVEKNDFDIGRTYGYDECLSILDNIGKAKK